MLAEFEQAQVAFDFLWNIFHKFRIQSNSSALTSSMKIAYKPQAAQKKQNFVFEKKKLFFDVAGSENIINIEHKNYLSDKYIF